MIAKRRTTADRISIKRTPARLYPSSQSPLLRRQAVFYFNLKQFGTQYGPPLQRGDKTACVANLHAEIERRGGVPYGWMKIYETLLFAYYNPRTGERFPSHEAIAAKAKCAISTVQRARTAYPNSASVGRNEESC